MKKINACDRRHLFFLQHRIFFYGGIKYEVSIITKINCMEKRNREETGNVQTRDLLHNMDTSDKLSENFTHIKADENAVPENNDDKEKETWALD